MVAPGTYGAFYLYKKRKAAGGLMRNQGSTGAGYASHIDHSSNPLPSMMPSVMPMGGSNTRAQVNPTGGGGIAGVAPVASAYTPPLATEPIGGAISSNA